MADDYSNLPDFDSLPSVEGMPQGCAWGVFDKDGKKDQLGCLNLLTPKVVQNAYMEARDGISISLNWPIGALRTPFFGRKGVHHKVISYENAGLHAFDDEIEFNTQCSSQWDSLVHYAHQPTGLNYNGVSPSADDLVQPFGKLDVAETIPTLNHWHARGGLVGRGILIDYRAYAEEKGIKYDCFDAHAIPVHILEDIAKFQGTIFKRGDILIVRTGYTEDLSAASGDQQDVLLNTGKAVGVAGNLETVKWVWNHHFSAVASDSPVFESVPTKFEDGTYGTERDLVLHNYFLSLFGLHIGEYFDLKGLGEYCKASGRYEFLLTSVPLNIGGLVGSPPNVLALF